GWRSPSPQDMTGPGNKHMRRMLTAAMTEAATSGAAPLVYAAGHDHSLQIFRGDRTGASYTLVSGLGSRVKSSEVRHDRATLFAHSSPAHPGFMELDLLRDGRARLSVIEWAPEKREGTEVYSLALQPGAATRHVGSAGSAASG